MKNEDRNYQTYTQEQIEKMKERYFGSHPDKKKSDLDYQEVTDWLKKGQELSRKMEVGQKEGTFIPPLDYPDLPGMFVICADPHYGSLETDYERLERDMKIVKETPNTFLLGLGDYIDAFTPHIHPSGMMKDPLPPQTQADIFMELIRKLDAKGKLAGMVIGNHDDWLGSAGYDFATEVMRNITCPVFDRGGRLWINFREGARYEVALTHKYKYFSSLNPSNSPRRLIETAYPNADVSIVGHYHYSDVTHRDMGGKDRILVMGGTYRKRDAWAEKMGLFHHSGKSGITIVLWPSERKMEAFKNPEVAQQFMLKMIFEKEKSFEQQSIGDEVV